LHQGPKNSYTRWVCRKEEIATSAVDSDRFSPTTGFPAAGQVQGQYSVTVDKASVDRAPADDAAPLELTEADLAQINARSRMELMQVVFAQALAAVVVALLAWLIGGFDAGWSALAGSAAYVVPNVLFAFRLVLATYRPGGSNALLFLVGEFLKVGAAVGLLWLLAHVGGERVVWLAVIAGLIAALKGYMLVLMFGKRDLSRPTNS